MKRAEEVRACSVIGAVAVFCPPGFVRLIQVAMSWRGCDDGKRHENSLPLPRPSLRDRHGAAMELDERPDHFQANTEPAR